MDEGMQRREAGQTEVMAAAVAVHREYREYAADALAACIASGRPFTADDVRAGIPDGMEPHSANLLPAMIGSAAARRLIVSAGWIRSDRPTRHASSNRMWIAAPGVNEVSA